MYGNGCVRECLYNAHSCAQTGLWRTMSRAWPAMSAIVTSSSSTCPSHWKGLLYRMLEKALLPDGVLLIFQHICKCFL